jgi:hypothetical protein
MSIKNCSQYASVNGEEDRLKIKGHFVCDF